MNYPVPNKTADYRLTIIVPIYNEAENMERLERELAAYLAKAAVKSCVLFVNDGSTDGSLELLKPIANRHDDFFYISFERNAGLSAAIKAGIDYAWSDYVGYIDADLQTTPDDFDLLVPYLPDYALVTGIRAERKDTFVKKMSSKIANGFRRRMTHDNIADTGCPLKVIRTEVARQIPFFKGMHRFLPALVMLQQEQVKQVPVRHFPRMAGQAKFNLTNRLVAPFVDCFAYRWMAKRYIRYRVAERKL